MYTFNISDCLIVQTCAKFFEVDGGKYDEFCNYLCESLNADPVSAVFASLLQALEKRISDFLIAADSEIYYNVIDIIVDECVDRIRRRDECAEVLSVYLNLIVRLDELSRIRVTGYRV